MAGKFEKQSQQFGADLGELFNRSIRQALLAGLLMAVQTTKQDSSNAAAHWLIGAKGRTRPGARKWGKLRDLRQVGSRPRTEPVGRRRDNGANSVFTEKFVRERELRDVIDKVVTGRRPATVFYFYHPIDLGWRYAEHAHIESAGNSAVAEVARIYQNRITAGQSRKNPL